MYGAGSWFFFDINWWRNVKDQAGYKLQRHRTRSCLVSAHWRGTFLSATVLCLFDLVLWTTH
jgi:hypothetical protein